MSKTLVSKLWTELLAAASVTARDGESFTDTAKRMVVVVQDLPEKEWNAISTKAQDYFNDVATALNKKKDVPEPPDAKWEEAEDAPRGRTRVRASDDDSGGKSAEAYKPKLKDMVTVTTSRDKVVTGKVVELDKDEIVLSVDGEDQAFEIGRLKSIVLAGSTGKAGDDTGGGKAEPEAGDTVQITTMRDKVVMGKIKELTDDTLVLELPDGSIDDFSRDRLKTIEVKAKGSVGDTKGKSTKDDTKDDGKTTRSRATTSEGVPATVRLRELIILNMDATKEDIIKLAAKEKLDVKDNTAGLTYAEVHKGLNLWAKHR